MKIKKLNLTNFRSHPDTTIDNLPRFVVIRGQNHSGKTSIVQALELALAARAAEATDDRGAGAKELIRTNAEGGKALVKLRLQNDPTIEEYRDVRCSLTEASGRTVVVSNPADKEAKGEDFAYWLTKQRDILSCLINMRHFITLPPKEQRALLAGIVLPESYDGWDKDALTRMQELRLKFNPAGKPFDEIAAAYKQAFEARTDVNREIKNHVHPEGDTTAAGDVDEVRQSITDCEKERDGLVRKKQQIESADTTREQTLKNLAEQKERAQAKLSTEQQEVEKYKKKVLSKTVLKERTELAGKKAQAQELDTKITETRARYEDRQEAVQRILELDKTPNCPRCRRPISEELVAEIAKPVSDERDAAYKKLEELQDQRKAIGDYEGAAREIAAHEQAKVDMNRSETRVTEAHREIEGINQKVTACGDPQVVPDELLEELAICTRKIQELTDRIEPVVLANALKHSKEDAKKKGQALLLKQSKLEELVKYFGPAEGGVQARLLSEHVGGFQQSMNKVLANWGYECSLQFEPYLFGIVRGDKVLSIQILSESEKHQFAIAFQVALAIHSGLLFAVVDASEIYDAVGRKQMFGALLNAGLDQVIVLGTDQRTDVPANPDLAYYMFSAEIIDDVVTTSIKRLLPPIAA